ncbi:MAG: SAP domain-containing protein [Gammaproteobacteria bacterium HGW-Gammaproteobacteria-1]|nr:MAG: SAP domain-containing protein [Gammaproteobacteria bacterium HGW-Gammaproteobacteria-1]
MNTNQIKAIAKKMHVDTTAADKAELVHRIQRAEGNFDCFASPINGICDQTGCLWRDDCFESARIGAH